jgi:hypothetical protein
VHCNVVGKVAVVVELQSAVALVHAFKWLNFRNVVLSLLHLLSSIADGTAAMESVNRSCRLNKTLYSLPGETTCSSYLPADCQARLRAAQQHGRLWLLNTHNLCHNVQCSALPNQR